YLALWLLHGHARHDLARLRVHHRGARMVAGGLKALLDLAPIWRLLHPHKTDLPGVGEELLLIASVTHLRRPNLERAAWQAVALAAPERGPQRLKVGLQEPRHAVDRRLVSLVHHLLPRLQALDLCLDELPALFDGQLGLPNLADGPLGCVVVVDLETVVVSLHLLLDVAEIVLSNAHHINLLWGCRASPHMR